MTYESLRMIPPGDLLADSAYAQLSDAILRNELPPGSSLSVPELARQFGISRSPVREAVQRLIYDGLADYRGRRGTVVSSIDIGDFVALLEVREVLEGLAARTAAQRGNDEELAELEKLQLVFLDLDDPVAAMNLDVTFHSLIRSMSRNAELGIALARTQARGHLSMHTLWGGPTNVDAVKNEHGRICAAILSRDPDLAESAAREHISSLRRRALAEVGASK